MKNIHTIIISLLLFLSVTQIHGQPFINDQFFDFCTKIVENNNDPRVVKGIDNWYFFKPELIHLTKKVFWGENSRIVSNAKKEEWADPFPAIIDFNNQLKEKGIELIFIPVPPKVAVYPEMLVNSIIKKNSKRLDYYHYEFYDLLRTKGVHVIDILPLLLENRDNKQGKMYCKTDTHWSSLACELVAGKIAKELMKKKWYKNKPKIDLIAEKQSIFITGDLVDDENTQVKEELKLRVITLHNKDKEFLPVDDKSPVVLIGDSHTLVFSIGGDMYSKGAGLADQLAYELGFPLDILGVRGSGSSASRINLYRKSKYDPDYLTNKKVVIWCISAREFTESTQGWKMIPVSP